MVRWLKGVLESILTFIVGASVTAAAVVFYFIPKRDKEKQAEADKKAAEIKAQMQQAHETRTADAAGKLAAIEQKADDALKMDSVDLANEFIKGAR